MNFSSCRGSEALQEPREPHQPLRPRAVAARRIDVSRIARVDQGGAPGIGDVLRHLIGTEGVGAAGRQERGEGQGLAGERREGGIDGGKGRRLRVRQGDEEGALHKGAGQSRRRMGERQDTEAVRDEHHRPRRARDLLDDAGGPGLPLRRLPIRLLHPASARQLPFPAGLPMVRPGIAMAGDHEDVAVGGSHEGLIEFYGKRRDAAAIDGPDAFKV